MLFLFQNISEPPIGSTEGLLAWLVGLLVALVTFVAGLYLKTNRLMKEQTELRVKDRDEAIKKLQERLDKARADKDHFFSEIRPTMEANLTVAKTVLDLIRNNAK